MRKLINSGIGGVATGCLMVFLLAGCSSDRAEDPDLESLSAIPGQIQVNGWVGGGQTNQQQFIAGGTTDDMWFEVSSTSNWIVNLRPDSGFTPQAIRFEADAFNLLPGTYVDSIKLESPGAVNSPLYVGVQFTVAPVLQAAPQQLSFLLIPGVSDPLDSQLVKISSGSGNVIDFSAEWSSVWVQLSQSTGSTPDSVWVRADRSGLEPGIYVDTIIFSASDVGAVASSVLCSLRIRAWLEQEAPLNLDFDLEEVFFFDSLHGWAVGGDQASGATGGIVLSTVDGGETWELIPSLIFERLGAVDFVSLDSGWVAGKLGSLFRTTNGGQSWEAQPIDTADTIYNHDSIGLRDMHFVNATNGWVVGDKGIILRTVDAGENWTVQSDTLHQFDLSGVSFSDASNGWAVGNFGTILHTTGGGANWELQDDAGVDRNLSSVFAISAAEVWAVGTLGAVMHTVDGGQVWQIHDQIPTGLSLWSVYFADQQEGWIVGDSGVVLHTVDAGVEWKLQKSDVTARLKSVIFVGTEQGWAVGQNGTIIHTFAGGE